MNDKNSGYSFDSTGLFSFIFKHRKPLIIITGIAILLSSATSFLIEPKFRSTVVIFPASSTSVSHELLNENLVEKNILKFGEEEEVEQLMQVLQSDEIRENIVKKYNLFKHYNIDLNAPYPKTKLINKYNSNISIKRTEYMSIDIEVLDKNPDTAANIANDISAYLDTVMNRMQKTRAIKALNIVQNEYNQLKDHVEFLQDSIKKIRAMGVFDYESQSEVLMDAYAQALAEGRLEGAKKVEEKLAILAKYGGAYASMRDLLIYEIEKVSKLESKYQEAKVDVEQDLPHKFIVNRAQPAEKKAYPIRWLIVLVASLSAFLLAMLILIVFENVKKKDLKNM